MKKFPPRGVRNNNPLNIRRGKDKWQGEVQYLERITTDKLGNETKTREVDRTFCQFTEMKYGYRAAFKLLRKYIEKYQCNTIAKIINRWAPPCENATGKYICIVCGYAIMDANTIIDVTDKDVMLNLVEGMCVAENGAKYAPSMRQEWQDALLDGYDMAMGV